MASYTYSLIDSGDGAISAYFGTASMSIINANQSAIYDETYVENNMLINTAYLEWDESTNWPKEDYTSDAVKPDIYYEESHTFPSNIDDLGTSSDQVFEWQYYSRGVNYAFLREAGWWAWSYESEDENGDPVELNQFWLYETYNL